MWTGHSLGKDFYQIVQEFGLIALMSSENHSCFCIRLQPHLPHPRCWIRTWCRWMKLINLAFYGSVTPAFIRANFFFCRNQLISVESPWSVDSLKVLKYIHTLLLHRVPLWWTLRCKFVPLTSQTVLTVLTFERTERTGEFKMERAIKLAVLYNRSNHYVTKLPAPLILMGRMNEFHFAAFWCDWAICCASTTLKEMCTRFLPTDIKTWGLLGSKILDMIWMGSMENLPKPDMHN